MLFLLQQCEEAGLPLRCVLRGSLRTEGIWDHGGKEAECSHFTDTAHSSCAGKKSGKGQEAVTRHSRDDAFAFLLLQPRQTFMFSLLSC